MVEQPFALRHVMRPGDALHPAAGLAAFAAVERDAGKMLRQVIKEFYAGIHALRRPGLHHRIESARRVHQKRRARAEHVVTRVNAIDRGRGHGTPHPLIYRPARARRTRPSSHGPPPKPPITGICTALTTAAPASGPELVKSSSAAPDFSRSFASATSRSAASAVACAAAEFCALYGMPYLIAVCGVRPNCANTGMPASTSARTTSG